MEGSGIEVREEGERTRILMPESAPTLWTWRLIFVVGLLVLVVMLAFGLWMRLDGGLPGLGQAVSSGVLMVLFIVQLPFSIAQLCLIWRRNRVELVVDRRGVAHRGWGSIFLWRVSLARAGTVMVCRPMHMWQELRETGGLATVRVMTWKPFRGIVWGGYEREVAMQAASILVEQIERVRRLVGVDGPAVALRDGLAEGVRGSAEEVLEKCRVRMEREAEGVRMELAPNMKMAFPREDNGYLAPPVGGRILANWLGVLLVGGFGGGEIVALSKQQGVWNAVGLGVAIASIAGFFAWWIGSQSVRLTYQVGSGGVERVTGWCGMKWRRRWRREEIESVYVRQKTFVGGGRVWAAGIRKRGGKEVDLAMGWRWTAEAFAEVVERELGMGAAQGR